MNRREFITQSALYTIGATLTQGFLSEKSLADNIQSEHPLSILQGITSSDQIQLTVDIPVDMAVQFRLINHELGSLHAPAQISHRTMSHSPWAIYLIKFEDLNPHSQYSFQVLDENGLIFDQRELRTANLDNPNPRLALVSCARDSLSNQNSWQTFAADRPDLLVFMGDNVYGDYKVDSTPTNLWNRYVEARRRTHLYHLPQLIPCIATWDDHDYGKNNSDGNFIHKDASLQIFNSFYARDEIADVYSHGPGVASCYRGHGLQILMLDNRYFRSDKKDKKGSTLGEKQKNWALEKLIEFNGPTWLVHGGQFFGGYRPGESYEGNFRADFMGFMEDIRASKRKVIFASGDIHYSELMRIEPEVLGYRTYELTSSSIHSLNFPFKFGRNKRRVEATTRKNFLSVQHRRENENLILNVKSLSAEAQALFKKELILADF